MSVGLTYYAANLILNHLCGRGNYVNFGTRVYVGLSTTTPEKDGSNITEPTGENIGYERTLLGSYGQSDTYKTSEAASGALKNNTDIMFQKATGAWGTCTHLVLFDASSGGHALAIGALTTSISPVSGDVPTIEYDQVAGTGDLNITLA